MNYSEEENRFRYARYILTNGYKPREKIELLERLGFDMQRVHGESIDELYGRVKGMEKDV